MQCDTTPTQAELEELYVELLSVIVKLARTLKKPSPIVTRAERRAARVPPTQYERPRPLDG